MAEVPIEAEIIDLIARERGLPHDKVTLSSRLQQDLRMDGDDAVEFFLDIEKRYDADLTPLYRHWSRHFGPEGFGSPMMFLMMFALLLVPLPLIPLGISPALIWAAVLVAIPVWLWPLKQWPLKDETIAVRVEDVVTAAKTKRWPIAYDEVS